MRKGCQWILALLLATGCAGGSGDGARLAQGGRESANGTGTGATAPAAPRDLPAAEAHGYLASHPEALILDVRDPGEWDDDLGHIEGAVQIPLAQLEGRAAEIAAWKEKPVVVVCRVGGRSLMAAHQLVDAGFTDVMNLEGGMAAWRSTEKPTAR